MNLGELSGQDAGTIGAICLIALLFGILYAIIIYHSKERIEGYTSLAVVAGVLITLALAAFIVPLPYILLVLLLFVCTGTPMIVGEIIEASNDSRAKSKELSELLQEHSNGHTD